jgi:hypothetical protein
VKPRRLAPAWAKKKAADKAFRDEVDAIRRAGELLGLGDDPEPVMVRRQVGWYNPDRLSEPFCLDHPPGRDARPMFDCSAFAGRPCVTCGKPTVAKSAG